MNRILSAVNAIVWGDALLVLLLGTGLLCLFAGVWRVPARIPQLFRRNEGGAHALSPLQACTTSLAAAMGTGNIAGVATALTLGGAGALFWMWVAALIGMALLYAENRLGTHLRSRQPDGTLRTGAIACLHDGLHAPWLAGLFALCCTAAAFGMGNMTQSNTMAATLHAAFRMPPLLTGILAAGLTGAVILGGVSRIGKVTEALIPVLSLAYLIASGIVLCRFHTALPAVFRQIFEEAFGLSALGGGISGAAVRHAFSVGVRRGVFSNEAGLGSSGLLHGETDCRDPEVPALWAMAEVVLDTFVCCTATALVILATGAMETGADGGALVLEAFRRGLGRGADGFIPLVTALFALCTLIGWSYCGSTAFAYLTKGRGCRLFQIVFCLAAAAGAVLRLDTVWLLADIANACMAWCHLPALLLLVPVLRRLLHKS